jgi:hypothetical protein
MAVEIYKSEKKEGLREIKIKSIIVNLLQWLVKMTLKRKKS